ncbi:MAG: family 20 glycosylhydrolase, partial [Paracoccaceae bacterium]
RFGWRGQHLDCARHFFDLSSILDLLDLMALLKLNRFHWHFADDEAFRLRLTGRPDLAACTAARGPGAVMPAVFGEVGGGSYGPADVAAVLERAHALNIEVLPEIETPAHMLAVTRVYPDTRDPADNGAEVSVQGYQSNAVNPAMPATWDVLSDIVTEVGAMFPFGHLHLGCDELPEGTWMGSPAARGLMAEHDLSDTDDIQAWMMSRLAAIVTANGQRPCAWEEAARGNCGEAHNGIGHGAILFSWSGQGPGLEAARAGYDVVMTPAQHVYLDMAHSDAQDDWGASWAAFVDLEDTVAWEPVPQDLRDTDVGARILGVQGAYWAEFTTQDAQMWPMLLPRIFGVATQAWEDQRPAPGELTRRACAVDWLGRCYGVPF